MRWKAQADAARQAPKINFIFIPTVKKDLGHLVRDGFQLSLDIDDLDRSTKISTDEDREDRGTRSYLVCATEKTESAGFGLL